MLSWVWREQCWHEGKKGCGAVTKRINSFCPGRQELLLVRGRSGSLLLCRVDENGICCILLLHCILLFPKGGQWVSGLASAAVLEVVSQIFCSYWVTQPAWFPKSLFPLSVPGASRSSTRIPCPAGALTIARAGWHSSSQWLFPAKQLS